MLGSLVLTVKKEKTRPWEAKYWQIRKKNPDAGKLGIGSSERKKLDAGKLGIDSSERKN